MAFTGSKYEETRGLKTTAIAKLVRAELKAKGIKARVRTGRATWTPTLDVVIEQVPEGVSIFRPEYFRGEPGWITPEAKAFSDAVEAVALQYQRDNSDPASDYFNVRFYLDVRFSRELSDAHRAHAEMLAAMDDPDPELQMLAREGSQERFLAWAGAS